MPKKITPLPKFPTMQVLGIEITLTPGTGRRQVLETVLRRYVGPLSPAPDYTIPPPPVDLEVVEDDGNSWQRQPSKAEAALIAQWETDATAIHAAVARAKNASDALREQLEAVYIRLTLEACDAADIPRRENYIRFGTVIDTLPP